MATDSDYIKLISKALGFVSKDQILQVHKKFILEESNIELPILFLSHVWVRVSF